ncbi:MAG: hypothetical protein NTY53_24435, partial [Kiritimatiellaeota bacterium]|nr:hypothetical protein [Kiritimatiellota bacterium]
DSASYGAEQRGSDTVTFEDVEKAIASIVIPSDQAMTIAYSADSRPSVVRRNSRARTVETPLQGSGNAPAVDLQRPLTRVMSPRVRDGMEDIGGRINQGSQHASRRGQLVPA